MTGFQMTCLQDPEGVEAFRAFLLELENESGEAGEHTKYIDFYLECEEYKTKFKQLEDKAKDIFEEYLAVSLPHAPVDYSLHQYQQEDF